LRRVLIPTRIATLFVVGAMASAACRSDRVTSSREHTAGAPAAIPDIAGKAQPGHPVIFLGLDAADWGLLDGYMARGVMPNLARLVAEGTSGHVKTLSPALSPLVWTTMMTGTSPLEHGILDFLQFDPATGQREPITSSERRVPAVWNMATAGGKRPAVFGLWATFPAEAVDGLIVSDRLFTFLYKEQAPPPGVVFPADRESWARDGLARAERSADYDAVHAYLPSLTRREYEAVADSEEPYAHPVSALRRMLIETQVYTDLSLQWIREQHPDLAVVYLQSTDTIGHVFAPYAPPRQAAVSQEDFDRYSGVPERFFRVIDDRIGQYRDAAVATGAALMIASDHGFYWGEGRPTQLSSVATASAAKWHAPQGIYLLWGHGVPVKAGHAAQGDGELTGDALGVGPAGTRRQRRSARRRDTVKAPRADCAGHYRPAAALAAGAAHPAADNGPSKPSRSATSAAARAAWRRPAAAAPRAPRGRSTTKASFKRSGASFPRRSRRSTRRSRSIQIWRRRNGTSAMCCTRWGRISSGRTRC
jgi:hypothetical protein